MRVIQEKGLEQGDFNALVGASGGPKWFVLFGLDKYLFGDFFSQRSTPLATLGSSAGSWRFACFGQQDPVAAIKRLAEGYSTTVYSRNAKANEISQKSIELLDIVLAKQAVSEIVNNPIIENNIIVARCKGLTRFENRAAQLTGLLSAAAANRFKRKNLANYFERVIMTTADNTPFDFSDGLGQTCVQLTTDNYYQSLLASGAIPMVLKGIPQINGAPAGIYRDGGIIDYHFDIDFRKLKAKVNNQSENLVLYPHFYPYCKPGWFDKSIASRAVTKQYYDNVVMLVPSQQFIESLPFKKIPDRKDFTDLDATERIGYWQNVLGASDKLADEFQQLVANPQSAAKHVQPIFI